MPSPTEPATSATPVLSTSELTKALECKPDLMPFHIEYDGPAPVSLYMKVESVDRGVGKSDSEDVNMKDGTEEPRQEEREGMDEAERYVSTFRGRRIHGLDMHLPTGYSGLVLRDGGTKKKGKGKKEEAEERGGEMVASGIFSGMRVWQADVPVDRSRHEYIRGLEEWTSLGNEIHREM